MRCCHCLHKTRKHAPAALPVLQLLPLSSVLCPATNLPACWWFPCAKRQGALLLAASTSALLTDGFQLNSSVIIGPYASLPFAYPSGCQALFCWKGTSKSETALHPDWWWEHRCLWYISPEQIAHFNYADSTASEGSHPPRLVGSFSVKQLWVSSRFRKQSQSNT